MKKTHQRFLPRKALFLLDGTALIPCGNGVFTRVSAEDVLLSCVLKPHLDKDGYAKYSWYSGGGRGAKSSRSSHIHRTVLTRSIGQSPEFTDHINGDRLDNRRENLRNATRSENLQNARPRKGGQSGLKGVSWRNRERRWEAKIQINGVRHLLGTFASKFDAARAYDKAALRIHGAFALTNETMGLLKGDSR